MGRKYGVLFNENRQVYQIISKDDENYIWKVEVPDAGTADIANTLSTLLNQSETDE